MLDTAADGGYLGEEEEQAERAWHVQASTSSAATSHVAGCGPGDTPATATASPNAARPGQAAAAARPPPPPYAAPASHTLLVPRQQERTPRQDAGCGPGPGSETVACGPGSRSGGGPGSGSDLEAVDVGGGLRMVQRQKERTSVPMTKGMQAEAELVGSSKKVVVNLVRPGGGWGVRQPHAPSWLE